MRANINRNVILSLGYKGLSVLMSLLIVPMTLGYLDSYQYGIWLTLSSVLGWMYFFDIGLGTGLRNKLSEALAKGDIKKARIFVSTTFALLGMIILALVAIFLLVFPFVEWNDILKAGDSKNTDIGLVVLTVFIFFSLQFFFKTVGIIYVADQRSSFNDFLVFLANLISLVLVFIATKTLDSSLLIVSLIFASTPVVVFALFFFVAFRGKYKKIKPVMSHVHFKYSSELMGLGLQFFIIQIAVLVIFSTSNIIITQYLTPTDVTLYNVSFKYFGVLTMLFSIIMTPLWSAYTVAFVQNNFGWIKKTLKRTILIWIVSVVIALLMLYVAELIYLYWVGDSIKVPFYVSFFTCIYVCVSNWNNITAFLLNGIGKIRLQLYLSVIASLLFVPLSIFLIKHFGLPGILMSMIFVLLPSSIIQPMQVWAILRGKAQGIWFK